MPTALKTDYCLSEASCNPFSRRYRSGPPRSQALIFFGSFLHQGKKEQSGEPKAQPAYFCCKEKLCKFAS
jgi:hypothetical protein